MPKYQITLIDVEVGDDADAKMAGMGAVSRILSCGGQIQGYVIQREDGTVMYRGSPRDDMIAEACSLFGRKVQRDARILGGF